MCKLLEVSRSGFYAWRRREESRRSKEDRSLTDRIRVIHADSRGTYGAPRVRAALAKQGRSCGKKRVARLMAAAGLRGCPRVRRRVNTTDSEHCSPIAPNLLRKADPPTEPNQQWVTDITYLPTQEGWLYLASVMDLYSRRIVGWAMKDTLRVELTLDALSMAIERRAPPAGLIHHSDRGSQYAAAKYQDLLAEHGMRPSMSGRGNCYDNAAKESFFGSLKTELVSRRTFMSHEETKASVFDYVEVFYNRKRLHSALGYQSPAEFEETWLATSRAA